MKNTTDYLYYRELYSTKYYSKRGYIEVILKNGNIKYLYFDKEKHIKFTNDLKFASKFYNKPKNYEKYVNYIKKYFNAAIVNYIEEVIVKNKY